MFCGRKINSHWYWVGGSDRRLSRFENLFALPEGVAYNTYLYCGEKTLLTDTADNAVMERLMDNLAHVLGNKPLDYLIVNHMEPDHCSGIRQLLIAYPNLTLVGNKSTFQLLSQFYPDFPVKNQLVVAEGDTLKVDDRVFRFFMTPMLIGPSP